MINIIIEVSVFFIKKKVRLEYLQLYRIDVGMKKKQMFYFLLIYKFIINNLKLSYIQKSFKNILQKCEKSKI